MSLEHLQNLFYHMCFDENFTLNQESLEKFVPTETAKHILSQNQNRLGVYRRLVFNNITDVIQTALPCFCSFHTESELQKLFREFLDTYKPRTSFYREIPADFLHYLKISGYSSKQKYPFLLQLADYEFCEYDLLFQKGLDELPVSNPDVNLEEAKLILNPNLFLHDYDFDLPLITKDTDPHEVEKQKTKMLIYRDVNDQKVQFFTLNPLSYSFLEIFLNDPEVTLSEGLQYLHQIHPDTENISENALAFLKLLLDKQVVLALV